MTFPDYLSRDARISRRNFTSIVPRQDAVPDLLDGSAFIITAMAILFAFLDVAGVQRLVRRVNSNVNCLKNTIHEIARQKEEKPVAPNPGGNLQ